MVKRLQKSAITAAIVTLCLLLAVSLVFAFVPATRKVFAEGEPSVWDGDLAAAGWGDTEVTAPDTYAVDDINSKIEIGSAAALAYFAHEVYINKKALDGYTVTLMTDIDLGGDDNVWIPIGGTNRKDLSTRFSGTFDGNGHTISNFSSKGFYDNIAYDADDGYYVDVKGDGSIKVPFQNDSGEFAFGLFGVTANMTVKRLKMSNVQFDFADKVVNNTLVSDNVGAIIGYNAGSLKVQNCEVGKQNDDGKADSTIKIATAGNPAIGGLVGRAYANKQAGSATTATYESVLVENCQNYIDFEYTAGEASDQLGKVSGILGYSTSFHNCQFINCTNYGNINGGQFAAGIMAFFSDSSKNQKYNEETDGDRSAWEENNAWTLNFDRCVNYGDITAANLDTASVYKEGKTYAGGITAHLSPSTDNYSSIISTNANYKKLPAVNFYITNCSNYGTIKVYNTEAKNGSDSPEGKGWDAAGGIIGSLTASETGVNVLTNNYNYGNVESIAKEGSAYYTPRMGGYIGWLYYFWGAELKTHPDYVAASQRKINLTMTGGSCGRVVGEDRLAGDGLKHVGALIGSDHTYPSKPCDINLVYSNDYRENIYREKEPTGAQKPTSVTIDAETTVIADGAYLGQNQLTQVTFADGCEPTKIGDWAFAGSGLNQINLPASVEEIGTMAFDGDVLVIANSKEHYDELKASDKVSDDVKKLLTYAVTINYYFHGTKLDSEVRLFNNKYGLVKENDEWQEKADVKLGTEQTGNVRWYAKENGEGGVVQENKVTEMLAVEGVEVINLYTFTSATLKTFVAREDLVYTGKAYGMSELNPLLYVSSDPILESMTATIEAYVDADGVEASADNLPTVVCNAGTYTIRVMEGTEDYDTFDVVIARATVDLGDYSNLSWRLYSVAITQSANNAELLSDTLYIYTDNDGNEYPAITMLTDERVQQLGLKSNAYTTRAVANSIVRNRNAEVTIRVADNDSCFTALPVNYAENAKTNVGKYVATVVLTATKNYTFTQSRISTQRGMTVEIDGNTATVKKTWYIVDMGNWLTSGTGDYTIRDRVYGETASVTAPGLQHGNPSTDIHMQLKLNGTFIGNEFGVADIGRYINRAMPAGNYELVVTVDGVTTYEVDTEATTDPENPVMISIYHNGFIETISFTVDKAQLPSLAAVNTALKGKTFTYTWKENTARLYDEDAAEIVNAYLAENAINRANTVWAAANYNTYYGEFAISFNLSRMQNDAYYGANDMTVAATDPGAYTVYYRISAPNYYSSIENLASGEVRQDYNFKVVIIREIEVPEVSNVAYTGFAVYPTVTPAASGDEAFYEVLWATEGYLAGGQRTVTFKLRDDKYYCWVGEEVGVDAITVPFKVVEATNEWLRTPNIVSWLYEEFNTEVNRIRAVPKFLDGGQTVKFTVVDVEGNVVEGLNAFVVNEDGTLTDAALIAALNGLKTGSYKLEVVVPATNNYKELSADIDFNIGKAMNSWANGDEDLVLPSWIIGRYNEAENVIVVNAAHGVANIIITDIDGNEYYNSVTGLNKLNDCVVGKYLLKAWVDETADFAALAERTFTIEVFEKAGMPWWGTLLITLGALLIAALIIFILWKKGVFQILTGKIVLAIRTKASVDATIAAVRASKKAEEAKKSVEAAKRREALEERKAKAAEERALPADQRAAALEEKAKKASERADKMKARAEAMQMRAERMKEKANEEAPVAEEPKAEEPAAEAPATEAPKAEAAATEEPKVTETPVAEEPKAEEPATETAATEEPKAEEPKTTKTPAKKKPSNKK